MNPWSKSTYLWCGGVLCYVVMLFSLGWALRQMSSAELPALPVDVVLQQKNGRLSLAMQFTKEVTIPEEGLLVPVGPDVLRLPGFRKVWEEAASAMTARKPYDERRGFDALQAINSPEELIRGAVYELPLSHKTLDLVRFDHYAVLWTGDKTLVILDLHRPERPEVLTELSFEKPVASMDVQDGVAYLLLADSDSEEASLLIVDLSNPERPRELAERSLPEGSSLLSRSDGQLFVAATFMKPASDILYRYEVDSDYQLTLCETIVDLDLGKGLFRQGRSLFLDDPQWGLQTFGAQVGEPFGAMGHLLLPDHLEALAGSNDRLFAWGNLKRLYTIDIADHQAPEMVRVDDGALFPVRVLFEGDYTYIFDLSGWIKVYDRLPEPAVGMSSSLSTPPFPGLLLPRPDRPEMVHLGQAELPPLPAQRALPIEHLDSGPFGTPVAADWWEGQLVVLMEGGRLMVLTPGKRLANLVATIELPETYRWLKAFGGHAYLGGEEHVRILQLDDQGRPTDVGRIDLPGTDLYAGAIVEDRLCLAAGTTGVLCYDLSDPVAPQKLRSWQLPRQIAGVLDVRDLSVCGHKIFAAGGTAGLLTGLFDAENELVLTGHIDIPGKARGVEVATGIALVATSDRVYVVDVRRTDVLQNLAAIDFVGVENMVVAPPGYWAGYVPGEGWTCLPMPRMILADVEPARGEAVFSLPPVSDVAPFRVALLNRNGQRLLPGNVSFAERVGPPQPYGAAHVQ